jgi:ketosteroid isomerase-like protein
MKTFTVLSKIVLISILISCQYNSEYSKTNNMKRDSMETEKVPIKDISELHNDYMSAWQRGDDKEAMGFWSDDIVMYAPGHNPHSGIYRGKTEVKRNLIERIYAETSKAEVLGLVDRAIGKDHVFAIVHERFTKADGRVFETERFVVYRWSNQKIIEVRYFDPDQKAADAFWSN